MKPVLFLLTVLTATTLCADDLDLALSLPKRTENKVFHTGIRPQWLPDGERFWYRVQTAPDAHEYVLVNAAASKVERAGNLAALKLPAADDTRTSKSRIALHNSKNGGGPTVLKFVNELTEDVDLFWISSEGKHLNYGRVRSATDRDINTYAGHTWLLTSTTGSHLAVVDAQVQPGRIIIDGKGVLEERSTGKRTLKKQGGESPDKKWQAFIENGTIKLRDLATKKVAAAATDMDGKAPFTGEISWAKDSSAFVVSNTTPVPERKISIIESSPADAVQPKLREINYAKPGDALPQPVPVIFRLKPGGYDWVRVKNDLFPNQFNIRGSLEFRGSADGKEFYFDCNQRGHQLYRIIGVDAVTGKTRTVVEETSKTFIDYTQKTWRHWLDDTGEMLWMSERSGWCHLYLIDVKTGQTKNAITAGSWPVRKVLHVDEKQREVWFMASGLRESENPCQMHLCRVKFDGSSFQQLTSEDGDHEVDFSPDRKYFIDTWSRSDLPPESRLRRSSDGTAVCELEKAVVQSLLEAGWTMPERFVAPGRDGKTAIHGVIIKPSNFDPAKKYPVVEEIYAGPHSAFAPDSFSRLVRQHQIAELGFIVVQADGMGTNHRGKTFHDVSWKNLKDAGFPDRIAWIKAAAQTRPWMDLSRVGIYGGSAGGQNAMRALLDYNDFYKVAVADCGCHDNRMDKIWWNEQWMGWPVDDSYVRSSNVADAGKLKGSLLLIVGELDTNVDPASTMQVVSALQKAGKSFEFMPIAGTGHGAAETAFGSRLRMEFLVKHLLQKGTP